MVSLNSDIELFWNTCHSQNKTESLSGCQYDETISFLKLQNLIKPNISVLEVGVGLGYVTKGLYDNGVVVSCLEISDIGIDRVKKYCENTYTPDDLEKIPSEYFDVILCNNVVQHMPTDKLIVELKHCIRSLKDDGVFAIEFVSNDEVDDMGVDLTIDTITSGCCCRSICFLEKIINDLGGKCELVFTNVVDFGVVKGHHVFHITKYKHT